MSTHLRLLSAAHRPPAPAPAPTSLHRLRLRLRGPPPSAARIRLLLRPPRHGGSQARFARAVRCAGEASAVARAVEDAGGGGEEEAAAAAGIWEQVRDIVVFAGPALGLWICGPLMSLIDTMVIGQTSALQLAALGPGTVFCDYLSYIFMFLSVATSNMVATSLAKKDEELAQHQVSMLLFLALACGIGMFLFTKVFGTQVLTAFTGSGNYELISSANTYAQIRGFAWPAVLVGLVAQSARFAGFLRLSRAVRSRPRERVLGVLQVVDFLSCAQHRAFVQHRPVLARGPRKSSVCSQQKSSLPRLMPSVQVGAASCAAQR